MKKYCKDCKKEFIPSKKHPSQNFCSKRCRELNIKKNNVCIDCSKELNSHTKYAKTIRCRKCNNLFKKGKQPKGGFQKEQTKGTSNINYKHGKYGIIHYCIDCNKEVSDASFIYGKSRCGKCYGKWRSKFIIKEKHPNWLGGISKLPYPFEFTEELKEQVRKRDNYECQNCGMTEEEHLIVIGTNLPVHHIDYNKSNCEENNLIALCSSCHFRTNFNRNDWTDFYQNKIAQLNKEAPKK